MKETYTGTQFYTVSVRPFVILFYFEHFEQSVCSFLFFRFGGGREGGEGVAEWEDTDTIFYTCNFPTAVCATARNTKKITPKITAGCESDSAWMRIVLGSWIRIRIRVKSWVWVRIRVTVKR
jgi:hypothetical protein